MRRNHDHSTNYTFQIHGIFWQVVHHIFYFTKVCGEIPNIFPPATSELENHSAKCTFWPSSLPPPSPCSLIFQPSFKLTELSAFFPYQQFCNFVKKTSNQQNNTKDWISNPEANEGTVPQLSHFTNCISPNVSIVFLPLCQLYFSYCANCISPNVSIIFLSFDGVSGPGQLCELVRCILGWVNDGSCHSRAPPLAAPTPDCAPDRNHPPAPDPGGKCHHRLLLAAVILGGCQPCDPSKLLHAAVTVAKQSIALH